MAAGVTVSLSAQLGQKKVARPTISIWVPQGHWIVANSWLTALPQEGQNFVSRPTFVKHEAQ
jgi:hypothetical protein